MSSNETEINHQRVVANTLNGARGDRCDIDGQAEGRMELTSLNG